ncbi:MAG: M12 family metallopeptidase [Legionella sp.]|nr:M12 family metallopeptidase [Legionella sp.]
MNNFKKIGCLSILFYITTLNAQGITGQAQITDPETGDQMTVNYVEKEGYAVIEGDIIIGTIDEIKRQGAVVNSSLGSRWPNGILPYVINEKMPNKNRTYIHNAITEIESKTNVRFVLVTAANKSKYKDYIEYMPSVSTCASYVGKIGGRQTISLAPGCYTGASIHETSHALGFWHEQGRADRDSYVRIVWANISAGTEGNFAIIKKGQLIGSYDYASIMHYGPKAFSKNGKDTIIPLQSGAKIGQRDGLSVKDIAAMNTMYPKKATDDATQPAAIALDQNN